MKFLAAILAVLVAGHAGAQAYPAKPVKVIVSSSAGSNPDLVVRVVTGKMSEQHGYTFVIENQPGAGGNIAPVMVAKAPADGYTLLMATAGPLFINPTLYAKLAYDIQRDFEPITRVVNTPNILAMHPSVPLKSVKELIAYAKANPGKLRFGSAGSGSSQHLSGELFKTMTGVDLQHIPYKSSSQMTNELLGGQIEISFQNASLILPYLKSGKLVGLAVTSSARVPAAGELPTLDESGLKGYEFGGGNGLLAPKGTPPAVLKKLEADAREAIRTPAVREQLVANGLIVVGSTAAEFALTLKNEIARVAPLVRAVGAKVD
jgi:tripartite-type tricarboxylate transporter receptor subunit TctC